MDNETESTEAAETFFMPAPEGMECKPGDTLTVVGQDKEGNLEIRVEKGEAEGEDWKSDMRKTVDAPEEPAMQEDY